MQDADDFQRLRFRAIDNEILEHRPEPNVLVRQVRSHVANRRIIGEALHGLVKRIDDLQNSVRIIAFEVFDDLQGRPPQPA